MNTPISGLTSTWKKQTLHSLCLVWLTLTGLFAGTSALYAQKAEDWANYARYAEDNERLLAQIQEDPLARPEVIFMGNSITQNWAKFRPEFFQENPYLGRGISGQVTAQMLARFQRDVVDFAPAKVVILAGINDIAENQGPIALENIAGNIKSMGEIAEANGIEPILCSVLPCARLSWRPDLEPATAVVALNLLLKAIADEKGWLYVDFYSILDDGQGGLSPEHSKDGCHPNVQAYLLMEALLMEVLQ